MARYKGSDQGTGCHEARPSLPMRDVGESAGKHVVLSVLYPACSGKSDPCYAATLSLFLFGRHSLGQIGKRLKIRGLWGVQRGIALLEEEPFPVISLHNRERRAETGSLMTTSTTILPKNLSQASWLPKGFFMPETHDAHRRDRHDPAEDQLRCCKLPASNIREPRSMVFETRQACLSLLKTSAVVGLTKNKASQFPKIGWRPACCR